MGTYGEILSFESDAIERCLVPKTNFNRDKSLLAQSAISRKDTGKGSLVKTPF